MEHKHPFTLNAIQDHLARVTDTAKPPFKIDVGVRGRHGDDAADVGKFVALSPYYVKAGQAFADRVDALIDELIEAAKHESIAGYAAQTAVLEGLKTKLQQLRDESLLTAPVAPEPQKQGSDVLILPGQGR